MQACIRVHLISESCCTPKVILGQCTLKSKVSTPDVSEKEGVEVQTVHLIFDCPCFWFTSEPHKPARLADLRKVGFFDHTNAAT